MEKTREDLVKRGLGLAAISYDSVATLKFFADSHGIGFPLLSDPDSTVIRAFGVLNEQIPKTTEFYGVPHPVIYVIDEKGIIRSRTFEEDFRRWHTAGNLIGRRVNSLEVPAKRFKVQQYQSDSTVHGGQRIKLGLELQLPPKHHVYAPGVQSYIPIDWKLDSSTAFEALPMTYPSSTTLYLKPINETVAVYEGKVVLEREIVPAEKYPAGELKVKGELRYQVCDDKQCYVPETIPLAWGFEYEQHDLTRAPVELRRKSR